MTAANQKERKSEEEVRVKSLIHSQDLINDSSYILSNNYYDSVENLLLEKLMILYLTLLFVPIFFEVDIALMLYIKGEILSWSHLGVKGRKQANCFKCRKILETSLNGF